ncbi:CTP:molybdopterin cytidylyltransferase MocA [Desulfobotulus alkaliphilus]|uniref:CTP:molybdopterin cytidylyltransferase MocA n=1 Tax=Desulfobotulus alkaliphilus TaxID=622671 RepID=A0A562R6U6_9BACT|nr:nucleotidyltransferase family protein [Desulfobotulus alkaliphilus]TWI64788.1 CTP:molybdopterin cytidylyltransferase MocA [Desulfobotulus alkaliphilus]
MRKNARPHPKKDCAVLILAAGKSSRMGQDKAGLPFGKHTVVEHLIALYKKAGLHAITVISGDNTPALEALDLDARILPNPAAEKGMFSSVQRGFEALSPETQAFFVHPVDIPLVSCPTLLALMHAMETHPHKKAFIPVFQGEGGHPPLLRAELIPGLLAFSGKGGLRKFLETSDVLEIPCPDAGILKDMDTPEAYRRLCPVQRLSDSPCPPSGRSAHPSPIP